MADSTILCNSLVPGIKDNHGPETHTLETYYYGPVAPCQGNHNFTRSKNHGICKYWEHGRCREGANCSFIHLRWKMLRDENSANGIKKVIDGIWYTNAHRDICRFREPVEQNPDGTLRYNGALLYTPHDHISIMFDPYQETKIHRVLDCSVLNHLNINYIPPEDREHHHEPLTAKWWEQWRFAAAKRMLWIQWL
ncbi:hypothetical protein B0T11DRAFT_318467 [Plectosphaerella cucumerina]|uniref:C3H1-type domain-containing protein n=1 Tax=Plectosphaerella cucumerina TaxID=40658 RepID=A0A8K0TK04_9PEZI|nr:hypothetical protein B0T11DRAFT_318467 [Plectosphaerella cucumerina]